MAPCLSYCMEGVPCLWVHILTTANQAHSILRADSSSRVHRYMSYKHQHT